MEDVSYIITSREHLFNLVFLFVVYHLTLIDKEVLSQLNSHLKLRSYKTIIQYVSHFIWPILPCIKWKPALVVN